MTKRQSPSDRQQAQRTARNKRLAAEKHGPLAGAVPDYTPRKGREPKREVERVVFSGLVPEHRVIDHRTGVVLRHPHLVKSTLFPSVVVDVLHA